jgi:hypothetical protein
MTPFEILAIVGSNYLTILLNKREALAAPQTADAKLAKTLLALEMVSVLPF